MNTGTWELLINNHVEEKHASLDSCKTRMAGLRKKNRGLKLEAWAYRWELGVSVFV